MNQILSTSMPMNNKKKKEKNTQPIAIGTILKFFSIAILVFGVFMIGKGAYAIYQNQTEKEQQNLKPTIFIENKTEKSIILKITHQRSISTVEYWWNEGEKTVIEGNGGQYVEKVIDIPSGKNTLHIIVTDINGNIENYDKQYELKSNIDIQVSENKIKIKYEGEKTISYMTYRWDEEDEKRIEINSKTIEEEIEAVKGLHTLTVIVVDENNNTEMLEQKINAVSKPKISIGCDEQRKHFVIKAFDEVEISRIEIRIDKDDNKKYELNLKDKGIKELDYVLEISEFHEGENFIEVTVYGPDNVSAEGKAKFVK